MTNFETSAQRRGCALPRHYSTSCSSVLAGSVGVDAFAQSEQAGGTRRIGCATDEVTRAPRARTLLEGAASALHEQCAFAPHRSALLGGPGELELVRRADCASGPPPNHPPA
mmetsp:Transcript_24816/g.62811  ORF Transcript_24816/g.62811 Transcript_24816/m.62811 type:complete len:112 (+) Transcript_24816:69-404(+)